MKIGHNVIQRRENLLEITIKNIMPIKFIRVNCTQQIPKSIMFICINFTFIFNEYVGRTIHNNFSTYVSTCECIRIVALIVEERDVVRVT